MHPSSPVCLVIPVASLLSWLMTGCATESPPQFIKHPVDQIGVSGGVASFVCQAMGDPKPRVTWNKKGKKVNSQRFETIEFDEGAGAVLRIQPLRTPRDENIYECVAQNSVAEITVNAKLTVLRGLNPPEPTPASLKYLYAFLIAPISKQQQPQAIGSGSYLNPLEMSSFHTQPATSFYFLYFIDMKEQKDMVNLIYLNMQPVISGMQPGGKKSGLEYQDTSPLDCN
ncbi:PREDICTED: receptor-type tyrosine-protein phosphatase S-like [Thamnophis sirtalis]|uniref:Receptor-type tyrosine-protein phosphatase S-like n=1 Tax=Thamnophis sirtalis TaxID=35019 RepID=A0A6I9XYJ6_9SAUR|nr:PREDICTED: receptor-type tyrosine-protein phosphatase S-like [Thamnophis sirtalis]